MVQPEIIDWKCQQRDRKNSQARSKQKGEREMGKDVKVGMIKKG